jgi:predicted MFS family arabinose efflux permease
VIGQALGGVLISANILGTGWRPVFLINVPVGIFLLVTSYFSRASNETSRQKKQDYRGVALLSAGLFLLVGPLVIGQGEGWPPWTWVCLAASVPVLVLFARWERIFPRRGGNPLINVALLTHRQISLGLVAQGVNRACYFALLFVLALYLQQGLGKSAAYSGMLLIAYMVTFGLAGPIFGKAGIHVKAIASVVGGLVIAASFAGMAAGARSTAWLIFLLGISGFGYGAAWSGILERLTEAAGPRYAPDVSGLFNTTLQVGGTMGTAVFGTLYVALTAQSTPQDAFRLTNTALAVLSVASSVLIILSAIGGPAAAKRESAERDP